MISSVNTKKGAVKVMVFLIVLVLVIIALGPKLYAEYKEQRKIVPWQIAAQWSDPTCLPEGKQWKTTNQWKDWFAVSTYIKASNPKLTPEDRISMTDAIIEWADVFGVPLGIVVALCQVESNFVASAVGPKTKYGRARGAMQVMYPVHSGLVEACGLKPDDLYTAHGGVQVGTRLLRGYITAEGSITGGLARYFSKTSAEYILKKVMTAYLTFEQVRCDSFLIGDITKTREREMQNIRKMVGGR